MDEILRSLHDLTDGQCFTLLGLFAMFSAKGAGNNSRQTDSPASSRMALTSMIEFNADLAAPLDIEELLVTQEPLSLTSALTWSYMYTHIADIRTPEKVLHR